MQVRLPRFDDVRFRRFGVSTALQASNRNGTEIRAGPAIAHPGFPGSIDKPKRSHQMSRSPPDSCSDCRCFRPAGHFRCRRFDRIRGSGPLEFAARHRLEDPGSRQSGCRPGRTRPGCLLTGGDTSAVRFGKRYRQRKDNLPRRPRITRALRWLDSLPERVFTTGAERHRQPASHFRRQHS